MFNFVDEPQPEEPLFFEEVKYGEEPVEDDSNDPFKGLEEIADEINV